MSVSDPNRPDTVPGRRPAIATSGGKLILLGEHAVVYGEPAIAVPVHPRRVSVVLSEPEADWAAAATDVGDAAAENTLDLGAVPPLSVDLSDDAPADAHDDVVRALGAAAAALDLAVPIPLRLAVRAGGLQSGMGTSAALGTALARALLAWHGAETAPERVLAAAAEVERFFHGNPSGIDHTVTALEQPVWFEKGRAPRPLEGLPRLDLVVLPRRASSSTRCLVDGVRDRIVEEPGLARTIAELGRWTREGHEAWAAGRMSALGAIMDAQMLGLDRLGVVHDVDREGVEAARAAGALGAKITGAGGGGTLLALASGETLQGVREAWGDAAFTLTIG